MRALIRSRVTPKAAAVALNEEKPMTHSPPLVAILDDDPDNHVVLKRAFEECRQDVRIKAFHGAEDLLDYLEQMSKGGKTRSTLDLALISLYLPGKTALNLVKHIKSNPDLKRIPLIVLSDQTSDPDIRECYDLGANTVITQPVLFDDLVDVVKILCEYWLGPVRT